MAKKPAAAPAAGETSEFTFLDCRGYTWDLKLTLAEAEAIDKADFSALYDGPISLLAPESDLLMAIQTRPSLMVAIIWAIVQPQIEAAGVSAETDFIRRFDGPTLDRARKALWGALADFFHAGKSALLSFGKTMDDARAQALAGLESRNGRLRAKLGQGIEKFLAQIDAEIDAAD